MAKVWLDGSALFGALKAWPLAEPYATCIRRAASCEPGMFWFCVFEPATGFREVDAGAVRAALDQFDAAVQAAPAPAPVPVSAPAGFRQQLRHAILQLPAGLQSPAMAAARAGARWLDGSASVAAVPAPEPAPAPPLDPACPMGGGDVYLSFGGAADAERVLASLRGRLNIQVVQAGANRDAAVILRNAIVAASQGGVGFEDRLQHLYMAVLADGDLCIDIGAHTGRHSLPMSCAVGSGRVEAFEPSPAIAHRLRARLACLAVPNITVNELALSDEAGTAEFVIAVDLPEESGLKERTIYNGPTRTEKVTVQLGRLDDLDFVNPRFIKLDTEGAEYKVLLGARQSVARWRPVVAFEFGEASYAAYNVDPGDVFDYFDSLDYQVMSIHGERLHKAAFVEASQVQKYWDYVACDSGSGEHIASILQSFGR